MQMDENGEYDDDFPVGLKVLIVDHDLTCLLVLEAMLRKLSYQVTKCQRARDALDLLREDENRFDIVLCSLHMPGMDGLKLLKIIRAEMDLPVVMITADDGKEASMKVIINGACDYLVKPVQMQTIRFIWQHVVRKREQRKHMMADHIQQPAGSINVKDNNTMLLQQAKNAAQRMATRDKSEDGEEVENPRGYSSNEVTTGKKQRVIWSQELHEVFVAAVHQLGRSKAVPKKILERMQAIDATDLCSGLSRANVASHLQKYRLHIRKGNESTTDRNRDVHPVYDEASSFVQYNLQYHPTTAHQLQVPVRNHGGDHPSHNQVRNNMYVDSVVPELTHCLPIELPSHGTTNLLLQNDVVFVSNDEHCYRNVGDYVSENSNSVSDVEELIYEPSFYVRQFDQDHFFRGPFA